MKIHLYFEKHCLWSKDIFLLIENTIWEMWQFIMSLSFMWRVCW